MSEFKIIDSQEAFDAAISGRLKRDREKYQEQFETEMKARGWKSPEEIEALTADLSKKIETLTTAAADTEKLMAEKDAKIAEGAKDRADLATTRIALAAGPNIGQEARARRSKREESQ